MMWLVTGYTWVDGGVSLRVRAPPEGEVVLRALSGRLSFRVLADRWCVGHSADGHFVPCPDRARLTGGTQCENCQADDDFRACLICDGFRCPRLSPPAESRCRQERHIYLACFGPGPLKVGTAVHHRRQQRIVEQGPLAAARVAHGDGRLIKQLEHLLAQEGFTESMRRSKKLALLDGGMDVAAAESRIREAASKLHDQVPREYHPLLHPPEMVEQPPLAVASRALYRVNQLPVEEDTVIEGVVVGAVGHVVFLEDEAGRFALDLGELKARLLEPDPQGPKRKPQVQLGLF